MRVGLRIVLSTTSLLAVLAAGLVVMTAYTPPAWAACPPDPVDPETGICASAGVTIPVKPKPDNPAPNSPGPAAPSCPGAPLGECQIGNAWWSSHGNCYAQPLDPQPAVGSPMWELHAGDATGGTIMHCADGGYIFHVPQGEDPVPDARTIAINAVKRVPFVTADLRTAPAGSHTYVQVENWLWVPAEQWHTVDASVTVAGTTVTVTADPSKIEWDMGDGHTVVCRSAGRPWVKGMTDTAKTDCGYAYETVSASAKNAEGSEGRFEVTAQFYYEVRWSCTGVCSSSGGALGEYPGPESPATGLEVRQRQTVVTQ